MSSGKTEILRLRVLGEIASMSLGRSSSALNVGNRDGGLEAETHSHWSADGGLEIDGVIDQLLGPRLPPNLKRRRVEHHQRRNRQEQNQEGKEAPRASISLRLDAPNTRRPAGWHEPIRSGRGISRKMVGEWDRTSDPCDVNAVASPEACRNPCDLDEFFPGSFSLSSRQPGANLGRKPLVLGGESRYEYLPERIDEP